LNKLIFQKNLVNILLSNNKDGGYKQVARMLNRKQTLNNDEYLGQIIRQFNYNIPDEFIRELSVELSIELINNLKSLLTKQYDPSTRLTIHKTIFRVQQIGLSNLSLNS